MSLYNNNYRRDELISHLRRELNLSKVDVTDDNLLKDTSGTFIFARIEFAMSLHGLWKELKAVVGLNG